MASSASTTSAIQAGDSMPRALHMVPSIPMYSSSSQHNLMMRMGAAPASSTPSMDAALARLHQLRMENVALYQQVDKERRVYSQMRQSMTCVLQQLNQGGPNLREIVISTVAEPLTAPPDMVEFAQQTQEFSMQMKRYAEYLRLLIEQKQSNSSDEFTDVFLPQFASQNETFSHNEQPTSASKQGAFDGEAPPSFKNEPDSKHEHRYSSESSSEHSPRRKKDYRNSPPRERDRPAPKVIPVPRASGIIAGEEDDSDYDEEPIGRKRALSARESSPSPKRHSGGDRNLSPSLQREPPQPARQTVKTAAALLADDINDVLMKVKGQKLPLTMFPKEFRQYCGRSLDLLGFSKLSGMLRSLKPYGIFLDNETKPKFVMTKQRPVRIDNTYDKKPDPHELARNYAQERSYCVRAGVCQFFNFAKCRKSSDECRFRHGCLYCYSKKHTASECTDSDSKDIFRHNFERDLSMSR